MLTPLLFNWQRCPDGYEVLPADPGSLSPLKEEQFESLRRAISSRLPPDLAAAVDDAFSPTTVPDLAAAVDDAFSPTTVVDVRGADADHSHLFIKPSTPRRVQYDLDRDYEGMFLELAHVDADHPSEVVQFATKFGLLRNEGAEELSEWRDAIVRLRPATEALLESQTKDDLTELVEIWDKRERPIASDVRLVPTDRPEQPRLGLAPATLGDAAWLQLAEAASEGRMFKKCGWCTTWFTYGPGTGKRSSAEFCAPSCQRKAARKRREGDAR